MSTGNKDFDSDEKISTGRDTPAFSGVSDVTDGPPAEVFGTGSRLAEEMMPGASETLDERLAALQAEVDRYKETALRSVADLDNYRKRMAREKEESIRYANFGFLERLIPVLDNFELGLQAAKASGGDQSAVLDGMTMVSRQLQEFLANSGVETIEAAGQPFNPNLHEAIAQERSEEIDEGIVIRQLRKGYRLKDRLIRPANVVVSKGKAVAEPAPTA
jgi:molecular chaperone GrpE